MSKCCFTEAVDTKTKMGSTLEWKVKDKACAERVHMCMVNGLNPRVCLFVLRDRAGESNLQKDCHVLVTDVSTA